MHPYSRLLVAVAVAAVLSQPSITSAQTGPDLTIAISHSGNFTVGVNGVYTIVVSNIGATATSGPIAVYDNLNPSSCYGCPHGTDFDFVSATGTGWSCFAEHGDFIVVNCSSTSVIAPGGSAFPITLTVVPTEAMTVGNVAEWAYPCDPITFICATNGQSNSDTTIVVAAVPTLPQWALIALTVCLALAGVAALRRGRT
jgi:hypothetical protein